VDTFPDLAQNDINKFKPINKPKLRKNSLVRGVGSQTFLKKT
jgi:hypothetical protein